MKTFYNVLKVVIVLAAIAVGVFLYATRPVSAPSQDINAVSEKLGNGSVLEGDTQSASLPASREGESGAMMSEGEVLYRISQENSTAEYSLDETLRGEEVVVTGTTNQVAGDVLLNLSAPNASKIGKVSVNARTFKTAEPQRDGAVGRFILKSEEEEYEYITFEASSISGLPDVITFGESYDVTVTGDLTILDTTKTVDFTGTMTVEQSQLSADLSVTIPYADYGVNVPDLPFIAYVEDEVTLTVKAVAEKVQQ